MSSSSRRLASAECTTLSNASRKDWLVPCVRALMRESVKVGEAASAVNGTAAPDRIKLLGKKL